MPNSTLTLPQIVDPSIIEHSAEILNEITQESQYRKFPFKTWQLETTSDAMSSLSSLGPGVLTIEGQTYGNAIKYQGYKKAFVVRKYTLDEPYTEELQYFIDRKREMGALELDDKIRGIMEGLDLNIEQDFAKVFYLGAGTTFITGGDSKALIASDHPSTNPSVAAQSNIITVGGTTNVVLAPESARQAFIQLDRFKMNSGTLVKPSTNKAIIASRQLLETAFRIKSSEYGPDTANLGFGVVSPTITKEVGYSFKVLPLHHMPDAYANYWFVVDLDKMKRMLVMAKMWDPRLNPELMTLSGVKHFFGSTIFGWNPVDWRWIAGSTGANALP